MPVPYTFADQGGQLVGAAQLDADFQYLEDQINAGTVGSGVVGTYSATGGETTITLNCAPFAAWTLEFFRDGVRQKPGIDYTVSTVTLGLTAAAVLGEDFWWVCLR